MASAVQAAELLICQQVSIVLIQKIHHDCRGPVGTIALQRHTFSIRHPVIQVMFHPAFPFHEQTDAPLGVLKSLGRHYLICTIREVVAVVTAAVYSHDCVCAIHLVDCIAILVDGQGCVLHRGLGKAEQSTGVPTLFSFQTILVPVGKLPAAHRADFRLHGLPVLRFRVGIVPPRPAFWRAELPGSAFMVWYDCRAALRTERKRHVLNHLSCVIFHLSSPPSHFSPFLRHFLRKISKYIRKAAK